MPLTRMRYWMGWGEKILRLSHAKQSTKNHPQVVKDL